MQWFLDLLEELGIECQVGDAAKIRAAEPRKQKHDRRDAELILKLLVENRFTAIWRPCKELLDPRALPAFISVSMLKPSRIRVMFSPHDKLRV